MDFNKRLNIISGIFTVLAFAMAVWSTFFSEIDGQRTQGIYWFLIAFVCAIIPSVKNFKFKDIELTLKEEISRIENKIDNRLREVTSEFNSAWEYWKDKKDSPEVRKYKDKVFKNYNDNLKRSESEERNQNIVHLNKMYLKKFDLSVEKLKTALKVAGFLIGEIDNAHDTNLIDSLVNFQSKAGIESDGIFGMDTYKSLSKYISE